MTVQSPWPLVVGLLGVVAAAVPVGAAGRAVSFRALDGRTVSALLFEADARPAPAVVLVPMLGRPKDDWQAAGDRLAAAGISALAIDLPGQGLPGDAGALAAWNNDVRAAVGFLAGRPNDVRAGSIGIAGASLGANLAVLAAAADPSVRSLALVSPSVDYRGVRIEQPLRQYGARPALLVASVHDPYAARSVRELADDPPGIRQMRWSETAAHGTLLLARDPDIVRSLVEWFQQTLG
jgi:alpha-beta hydrolase superfamily lysophospholipase